MAKLKDSILLQETMKKIEFHTKHQRKSSMEIEGPVEHDPEYLLIVDANNLLVQIDNEIVLFIVPSRESTGRDSPVEQLVQLPLDYLKTVQELGNNVDRAKMNVDLQKFLTQATIMIVSVSASTTGVRRTSPVHRRNALLLSSRQNLTDEELERVMEACQMVCSPPLIPSFPPILSFVLGDETEREQANDFDLRRVE